MLLHAVLHAWECTAQACVRLNLTAFPSVDAEVAAVAGHKECHGLVGCFRGSYSTCVLGMKHDFLYSVAKEIGVARDYCGCCGVDGKKPEKG